MLLEGGFIQGVVEFAVGGEHRRVKQEGQGDVKGFFEQLKPSSSPPKKRPPIDWAVKLFVF